MECRNWSSVPVSGVCSSFMDYLPSHLEVPTPLTLTTFTLATYWVMNKVCIEVLESTFMGLQQLISGSGSLRLAIKVLFAHRNQKIL